MDCLNVRDRLAEHALGTLPAREGRAVDRHLRWCAACRKEARDLLDAAATVAFALQPAPPPPAELEERVVRSVRRAAGKPA
ncbi:MAG TPA: zf-HC2 domain-containing protein, partial [Actinomycetota bacterium]|nr:zf-HC2 domain-containing protein [Actinomycetota bacterium]